DGAQQRVSERAAEGLIDRFESVEIQQQERHGPSTAQCARGRMSELVEQVLPVRNTCQPIETRKIVDLDLGAFALDRIADGAQDDAAVSLPLNEIVLDTAVEDLD